MHKAFATLSGAVGGAFGLPALAIGSLLWGFLYATVGLATAEDSPGRMMSSCVGYREGRAPDAWPALLRWPPA